MKCDDDRIEDQSIDSACDFGFTLLLDYYCIENIRDDDDRYIAFVDVSQ